MPVERDAVRTARQAVAPRRLDAGADARRRAARRPACRHVARPAIQAGDVGRTDARRARARCAAGCACRRARARARARRRRRPVRPPSSAATPPGCVGHLDARGRRPARRARSLSALPRSSPTTTPPSGGPRHVVRDGRRRARCRRTRPDRGARPPAGGRPVSAGAEHGAAGACASARWRGAPGRTTRRRTTRGGARRRARARPGRAAPPPTRPLAASRDDAFGTRCPPRSPCRPGRVAGAGERGGSAAGGSSCTVSRAAAGQRAQRDREREAPA